MSNHDRTEDTITVLTLVVGSQLLAIPAANLREILDPLPRTRVPGASGMVPWVMNVRGSVVPLAELRIPLGLDPAPPTEDAESRRRFVVLDIDIGGEHATAAIVADAVQDVTTLQRRLIEPLPPASQFPAAFVTGLYRSEGGFVLVPDLSALFTHIAQRSLAA